MVWDDEKIDDEGLTPAGRLLASEYNALVAAVNARVLESLFDANTILKADSDDTPAALTVAEQTLVGRITAGVITGLTAAQVKTLLSLDEVSNIKVNLIATVAPTVNDDSGDGYSVLSRWADITADKEYVCLDATVGAAVWTETTGSDGGGSSTANIFLPAEAAYLPVTNPAGLSEELGTTVYAGYSHLKFDDTTSEHAVWRVPMPDYDGGNIVVTAYSKVTTTPSGAVTLQYNILTIGLANSEAFDEADTVDTTVNISHSLNTSELLTDIMVASATIDPANVAADDFMVIELSRDVASDNLAGDGELVAISIEYTRA